MWTEDPSAAAVFVTGAVLAGRTTTAQRLGEIIEPGFDVRVMPLDRPGGWRGTLASRELVVRPQWVTDRPVDAFAPMVTEPRMVAELAFLRVAGAIVFIADAQEDRRAANVVALARLRELLLHLGRDPDEVRMLIALNKQDLPNIATAEALRGELRWRSARYVETAVTQSVGLLELQVGIAELVG
jgi:hypothetical protein